MANMSYCRFRNTLDDYNDCYTILSEIAVHGEENDMSDEEIRAAKKLIKTSYDLLNELGFIKDDGSFDEDESKIFFERLIDGCY